MGAAIADVDDGAFLDLVLHNLYRFRAISLVPTRNSIVTVETRRWCVVTVADESRARTARDAIFAYGGGTAGAQRPNYGRGRSGRYARRERRSSRATFVVVMQTADVWDCDDRATDWRLGRPINRMLKNAS
jgi:hypothetical protein